MLHQCLRYWALSVEVEKLIYAYSPRPSKHWTLDLEVMVTARDDQRISVHILLLLVNIHNYGYTSRKCWLLYCKVVERMTFCRCMEVSEIKKWFKIYCWIKLIYYPMWNVRSKWSEQALWMCHEVRISKSTFEKCILFNKTVQNNQFHIKTHKLSQSAPWT